MANALLVAWRSGTPERGWQPVGRLEHDGGVYRFVYTQGAKMLADFQPFPQMENLEEVYGQGFSVFANRLLSKSRPGMKLTCGGVALTRTIRRTRFHPWRD